MGLVLQLNEEVAGIVRPHLHRLFKWISYSFTLPSLMIGIFISLWCRVSSSTWELHLLSKQSTRDLEPSVYEVK